MIEEQLCSSQDEASEWLAFAWRELDRRKAAIGKSYPIEIENLTVSRTATWRQSPAYSFCLLLSFADRYKKWSKGFGNDHTEQGLLFEQITAEALKLGLEGWNIHATGWSSARAAGLKVIVTEVGALLGEKQGDLTRFPGYKVAKDAGLDVLMFLPFSDNRVGFPLYLVQCASGANWAGKRHQPNIDEWRTFIDFAVLPKKALAIPFAIPDDEFWWKLSAHERNADRSNATSRRWTGNSELDSNRRQATGNNLDASTRTGFASSSVKPLRNNIGRWRPLGRIRQRLRNQLHHFRVDPVSQRLEGASRNIRKVGQRFHGLQARALPDSHVTLLPSNYRYLRRRHCNQRGCSCRPLNTYTGSTKLNDILPDIALLTLAVPLKFLKTRRKLQNLRNPRIDPFFVCGVQFPILPDKGFSSKSGTLFGAFEHERVRP